MVKRITATEAARRFSDLLSRVRYAGESFLVVRNGEVMCRIEPEGGGPQATLGDLLDLLQDASACDEGFAEDLEAVQREQPKLPRSPWAS